MSGSYKDTFHSDIGIAPDNIFFNQKGGYFS